jgi:heptosyltransferase-2
LKKILIIQTASLGDVILATPLIEKLHRFYPHARIDFILKYGYEDLLRGHPYLKFVMVWDKTEHKYRHLKELIEIVRENRYDLVVNAQRFASSGLITALSGAKHRVGFGKNPLSPFFTKRIKHKIGKSKNNPHETVRNLKLIEHFTDNSVVKPKLYPSKHDFASVSQYKTRKYITVSPASLWFTKQYPKEKWIEFASSIDKDLTVYFLGSGKEKALCDDIIKQSGNANSLNLAGRLSVLESAALMRDAIMNYTNDSAPMHLASAMNAPVAAVYCSTVPEFGFGPLSDVSHIIQTNRQLSCRPCGLHGYKKCPKKHFDCANTIENNQLLSILKTID